MQVRASVLQVSGLVESILGEQAFNLRIPFDVLAHYASGLIQQAQHKHVSKPREL